MKPAMPPTLSAATLLPLPSRRHSFSLPFLSILSLPPTSLHILFPSRAARSCHPAPLPRTCAPATCPKGTRSPPPALGRRRERSPPGCCLNAGTGGRAGSKRISGTSTAWPRSTTRRKAGKVCTVSCYFFPSIIIIKNPSIRFHLVRYSLPKEEQNRS
jgi:hypothetical protein